MLARPTSFDGQPILAVEDIALPKQGEAGGPPPPAPPVFWLSVPVSSFYLIFVCLSPASLISSSNFLCSLLQYAAFYKEHGLSVPDYLQAVMKDVGMSFISSPEIGFLKEIGGKVDKIKTKLIFEFLESPTTLVADAHKAGLEIYASGFVNDMPASYNYSYDPTAEYQVFMDSPFSVDGVVTDFPTTAAETIACFSLAYEQAVKDGADVIDCSVQMSKDGVAFCLDTADLMGDTNAVTSFMARSSSVPSIEERS